MRTSLTLALAAVLSFGIVAGAHAQSQQLEQRLIILEQQIDGLLRSGGGGSGGGGSSADIAVRLDQLENQVRSLTGQIEAMQFELNRLRGGGGGGSQPQIQQPQQQGQMQQPQGSQQGFDQSRDVFQSGQSSGQSLGDQARGLNGGSGGNDSLAPLDLSGLGGISGFGGQSGGSSVPSDSFSAASNPNEAFEFSRIYIQTGEYDLAEAGFRQFIDTYPDNQMVPEARFWIGESQLQRNQYRQAAETYLGIYERHGDSPLVPESLYKLGVALEGLNAPSDACGAYFEAASHPRASGEIRQRAQQEAQRLQCS